MPQNTLAGDGVINPYHRRGRARHPLDELAASYSRHARRDDLVLLIARAPYP